MDVDENASIDWDSIWSEVDRLYPLLDFNELRRMVEEGVEAQLQQQKAS